MTSSKLLFRFVFLWLLSFGSEAQNVSPLSFLKEISPLEGSRLAPIIKELSTYPDIKITSSEDLVDFASEIEQSGLELKSLASRIIRYLERGELLFTALDKAIKAEHFHKFKERRNREIRSKGDTFVKAIENSKLANTEKDKVINAYAVCIDSYRDQNARENFFKPNICPPLNDYETPRHFIKSVSVCEVSRKDLTPQAFAYRLLIDAAVKVSSSENLNNIEKVLMAKCIAEQSLRFFIPSHHPFKALGKLIDMDRKSPEEAFFMKTGVCGNFSGIAYNIASSLGVKEINLAKRGFHIYLEFKNEDQWYHTHPFNSKSRCNIVRFK